MSKILVVDDQIAMRNMFKTILRNTCHQVDLYEDGRKAYNAAVAANYDLVLTDLYMPEMNGIELTTKLRKLATYTGVPIFIVSTEGSVEKKQEGKAAGASGWVVKPIKAEVLLPMIDKLLQ